MLALDTVFSNFCKFCLTPVGSHIRMAFIKYLRTIVSKQVAIPVRTVRLPYLSAIVVFSLTVPGSALMWVLMGFYYFMFYGVVDVWLLDCSSVSFDSKECPLFRFWKVDVYCTMHFMSCLRWMAILCAWLCTFWGSYWALLLRPVFQRLTWVPLYHGSVA